MAKHLWYFIRLCPVMALILNLNAATSRADDASKDPVLRLRVTESFSPIGKLHSIGGVRINGRRTDGENMVWAGDMIEAPSNSSVRVSLNSIGRITLKDSAIARLATAYDTSAERHVLVAWVLEGDMAAQLEPDVSAYVEASGSTFSSSNGASFRITSLEGHAVADAAIGAVWDVARRQQEYSLQRVAFDPTGRIIDLGNRDIKKKRREPEPINARLTGKRATRRISFTSATGEPQQDFDPIPNETVLFELIPDNPNINLGTITQDKAQTDSQGVASTTFVAGNNSGTGKLRITVPRLGISKDWKIVVLPGFWTTRNKSIIGAAAFVGILIISDPFNNEQIMQQPPPDIP